MPEFYVILDRKIIKIPEFFIFARKIYKFPEFYMIFVRKMPEFYIIIARKIFFPNFKFPLKLSDLLRTCPSPCPVSYAYGVCSLTCVWPNISKTAGDRDSATMEHLSYRKWHRMVT